MRGILSIFLELSAIKGEWVAALNAVQAAAIPLQLNPAGSIPLAPLSLSAPLRESRLTGFDVACLTRTLLQAKKQQFALAIAGLSPIAAYIQIGQGQEESTANPSSADPSSLASLRASGEDDLTAFLRAHTEVWDACFGRTNNERNNNDVYAVSKLAEVSDWEQALWIAQQASAVLVASLSEAPGNQTSGCVEEAQETPLATAATSGNVTDTNHTDEDESNAIKSDSLAAWQAYSQCVHRWLKTLVPSDAENALGLVAQWERQRQTLFALLKANEAKQMRFLRMTCPQPPSSGAHGSEEPVMVGASACTAAKTERIAHNSTVPSKSLEAHKDRFIALLSKLRAIHDSPKSGHMWRDALTVLGELPILTADAFCLSLPCLTRQGRIAEVRALAEHCLLPRSATPSAAASVALIDERGNSCTSPTNADTGSDNKVLPPLLVPTPRLVKALAEAAHTLHSPPLAEWILTTPALANGLTPSAAVPLVLTLQRGNRHEVALAWWAALPSAHPRKNLREREPTNVANVNDSIEAHRGQANDKGDEDGIEGNGSSRALSQPAPLRAHLKLSNYMALCYLTAHKNTDTTGNVTKTPSPRNASAHHTALSPQDARWLTALSFLADAKNHDPALALLFSLRLLRVARAWEPALHLVQSEIIAPLTRPHSHPSGSNSEKGREGNSAKGERDSIARGIGSSARHKSKDSIRVERDGSEQTLAAAVAATLRASWHRSPGVATSVERIFTKDRPLQWMPAHAQRAVAKEIRAALQRAFPRDDGHHSVKGFNANSHYGHRSCNNRESRCGDERWRRHASRGR